MARRWCRNVLPAFVGGLSIAVLSALAADNETPILTAVHRSLGFDHTGRVDVELHPALPEGRWLLEYLTGHRIPYFAFRHAVPGKATGAHIHIGPMSTRLAKGG